MNMPIEVRQVMSTAARGPVTTGVDAALDAGPSTCCATLAPQVLGAVIRRFGDFAAAEDAVQEALLAAAMQWPEQGVPEQSARVADPGRVAADDRSRPRARSRGGGARAVVVEERRAATSRRPRIATPRPRTTTR